MVKVLDFGLAKAFEDKRAATDLPNSPTKISGSVAGVIMGTPAYMSPEQARGKDVDARTDLWAFGCVLYEMLTSHAVFQGDTATDIIAKIIEGRPDWTLLPVETPATVRLLLEAGSDQRTETTIAARRGCPRVLESDNSEGRGETHLKGSQP